MEKDSKKLGLSKGNINFIVILIVVLLLLFGPIEPYGIIIRIAYLVIIPTIVWWGLKHFGSSWEMDKISNDRLNRTLAAIVAGMLLVSAYSSYTSKYHTECDQYEGNQRDGYECVGDYLTVKGSDKSGMFMKLIFAGFAIWFAVAKRSEEDL